MTLVIPSCISLYPVILYSLSITMVVVAMPQPTTKPAQNTTLIPDGVNLKTQPTTMAAQTVTEEQDATTASTNSSFVQYTDLLFTLRTDNATELPPDPPYTFQMSPVELDCVLANGQYRVAIQCTDERFLAEQNLVEPSSYVAVIRSRDQGVVTLPHNDQEEEYQVELDLSDTRSDYFTLDTRRSGRTRLMVELLRVPAVNISWPGVTVATMDYSVSVVRKPRMVDRAFNCAVAAMVVIGAFSLGCTTDATLLWYSLRHPHALIVALSCQFVLMPLIALAVAKMLELSAEYSLGLLCVACVPGGGIAHVIVSVMITDRTLSIAMNAAGFVTAIGTVPFWLFVLGRFVSWSPSAHVVAGSGSSLLLLMYKFELWLVSQVVAYILGVALNYTRESVAEAFLNWFVKPMLLLCSILFVTVGLYINMYAFELVDPKVAGAAFILPAAGFALSTAVSYASRQPDDNRTTITTETMFCNCMVVIVSVRFSLPQPDSDLVSTLPMWIVFVQPLFFIGTILSRRASACMQENYRKRCESQKQYRHLSIVSSLINVTNVTTLSSGLSPKSCSPADDSTTLIDQKVTVL